MSIAGFILLAIMITAYIVLDGYDLGTAAITPLIARTGKERAASMESIGPFWNGNEVWLIAAGASLFALFPQAYASSFSGFYLPFMVVLWLLMFRGIAMELRSHFASELWQNFWDFAFTASSALLILLFGVALGNIVRGVPLDANGYFPGTFAFLLNPYALAIGVLACVSLGMHGAAWILIRIDGPPAERSRSLIRILWWIVLVLYVAVSVATVLQHTGPNTRALPDWLALLPVITVLALIAVRYWSAKGAVVPAFAASSVFLAALFATAAATIFPYILPGYPAGHGGLSIASAAPSPVALASALTVTIVGLCIVVAYTLVVSKRMMRKIVLGED
ncbi:MAG: cytochrome d ubiquinol oxidase subunit II [Candidatus Eremiobacteraeota bacterium]|nr:cytochrome d ubiquinol oxidase subunit II [Candidatus Eremiobacteraeota bacterium]